MKIDKLDYKIINELHDDGRKSLSVISRELEVSVGTIRNRITKLIEEHTISIVCRVNPFRVDFDAFATIFISVKPSKLIDQVADQAAKLEEVSFLCMVSGEYDLWVDVMCKDHRHLRSLLTNKIHMIDGVDSTKTESILKVIEYKQPNFELIESRLAKERMNPKNHAKVPFEQIANR